MAMDEGLPPQAFLEGSGAGYALALGLLPGRIIVAPPHSRAPEAVP